MEQINAELLKYAADNGIIDIDAVQRKMEMSKRQKYLEKHPYNVWYGKDNYWHTYLPDEVKGRKHIKKKEQKDIEDTIIEYQKGINTDSFKKRYEIWMERQEICGRADKTIVKYISDYKRFFAGYPIEKKNIQDISDVTIMEHFRRVLNEKEISYRALKGAFSYVRGVFRKSVVDKLIKPHEDPCQYVDIEMLRQYCTEGKRKTDEERTLSNQERKILLDKILNPKNYNGNQIVHFAVELSLYTGMRVGELAGLMWEDVDWHNKVIHIRHQEIYKPRTKEYAIKHTKNGKERIFPMTDSIEDILKRNLHYQKERNFLGDFVFQDKNGRVHTTAISECVRNKTMTSEFSSVKCIHAIRRTFNSNLKRLGLSTPDASALVGNTERVNEEYYTYGMTPMNEKKALVEAAGTID